MRFFSFKTRTRKKRQQYLAGDDRSVTSIPEQLRCKEKKKARVVKMENFCQWRRMSNYNIFMSKGRVPQPSEHEKKLDILENLILYIFSLSGFGRDCSCR